MALRKYVRVAECQLFIPATNRHPGGPSAADSYRIIVAH